MNLVTFASQRLKAADKKAKRKAKRIRLSANSDGVKVEIPARATLKSLRNSLQAELNAAVRRRDGAVCISCPGLTGASWQAGHLFGVGAFSGLRFHPWNINVQDAACNVFRRGNHAAYAAGFIRKYGLDAFEALDAIKSEPRQWRIADLLELRSVLREGGLEAYQHRYFRLTGFPSPVALDAPPEPPTPEGKG